MRADQYKAMYEHEDTHWWFLAKRDFITSLLPKPQQNLKILDVGAGTGGMSVFLGAWGKVLAVENSKYAIPYLKKRGVDYIKSSVEMCSFKPDSFDLICAFDVLYHKSIHNDEQLIHKFRSWLKPGGMLCVTDCAVPSLFSHHDQVMHARKRYKHSELVSIILKAKLNIQKATYIYFFTFPLFILVRLIDKYIPLNTVAKVPAPINTLLLFLCFLESKLLPYLNFPIGSSILVVAVKQ
ncbi:hypothetical protein A3D03_00850 [Candidatus Gottesmanbacteria bacterium RIFCSPHIGHO2_02_FULL_40_13]|uniref:Uncharacterized protein n=1 Tax=Candidatus Gottesmanbacteria bacterium RIFCSPHIGHO2_02_FULL_40_13 TaxID=1798384 RepID=A0A1F6A7R1_9BACT|nr:MAG: hypothetical protein A3D03_00850 [Candidatus Gottesmanbacteria bacterium RIFCSPHIGHO2_02_FULL_40_13]